MGKKRAKKQILVTGGCGYIGSHTVKRLSESGFAVTVIDNLSTGKKSALLNREKLYKVDLRNRKALAKVFKKHRFDVVIHFAASIIVPESMAVPLDYYDNNINALISLLEQCKKSKVPAFVMSSTAAVYAGKGEGSFDETDRAEPFSPYGRSKLACEWILEDACRVSGMRSIVLRYFNVAGADEKARIGQQHPMSTHIVKVCSEVAAGKRPALQIYGDDYNTPDGTCIRDYVHVEDLAAAHEDAARYLMRGGGPAVLNCGYGQGFSVKEVIAEYERILGRKLPKSIGPRREGDVPKLVARCERIRDVLGWRPQHDSLEAMITSALRWEEKLFQKNKKKRRR